MTESEQTQREAATSAKRLAFNQAFEAFGDKLFEFFRGKLRNTANAEDLSQAFWAQVYKQFTPAQFFHIKLLQRKANQVLANYFRHAGIRSIVEFTDKIPEAIAPRSQEAFTTQEEADLQRRFWEMFTGQTLSASDKHLFWLRARHEFTFPEISEELAIPLSTVQDRFRKICDILAELYNRE